MKKNVLIAALIAAMGAMTDTSAQISKGECRSYDHGDDIWYHPPGEKRLQDETGRYVLVATQYNADLNYQYKLEVAVNIHK